MKINLTDNNAGRSNVYCRKAVGALFPIADKAVAELCRENENLLVFPHSIDLSDDIGGSPILSIVNTDDPDRVCLKTNNVMGFIGVGDVQLKIRSRFDCESEDYFLHYMLQRIMSFNLFELMYNSEYDGAFDFVMFMFPYYLKSALRHGIYREYKRSHYNDTNPKGIIELNRHLNRNIPFVGNFAYSTREYSHDNHMTQLIRHTIEYIMTTQYGQSVLNIDKDTVNYVQSIIEHTPSYNKGERSEVINKNLRLKSHPYFMEYIPLQKLCIQILRMEEIKYGYADDNVYGILFDGAWLWEEYVNTLLREYGFVHPENKLKKGRIYLFEDLDENGKVHLSGVRYPDFYKENIVLDAKYKRFEKYERVSQVDRNDIHQVITYMNNQNAMFGGFIVPYEYTKDKVVTSFLKGRKSRLSIYGLEIYRNSKTYREFCSGMALCEKKFIEQIIRYT